MTDVNVQYFSHLNGLSLGNNWGDLINLLDVCLVNGLPFSSITSATISELGDINLTLSTAHNAMLFQIVELSGFSPSTLNKKYRVKGVPSTTQLILKADLTNTIVSAVGSAKLASLGYDIVFTAQGKRVYRAKNPTAQHPFIRVDETLSDGTNTYTSTYAKSAMVGLIENMTHIDDYEDPTKLQLPMNLNDLKKNWKITGTGNSVIRGWSKWYWATSAAPNTNQTEQGAVSNGNRYFSLVGDSDAFYFLRSLTAASDGKVLSGAGLFNSGLDSSYIPNWYLMGALKDTSASTGIHLMDTLAGASLAYTINCSAFFIPKIGTTKIVGHDIARPIMPDYQTGAAGKYTSNNIAALEIPFSDDSKYLRGSLKHAFFCGDKNNQSKKVSSPVLGDNSMYLYDSIDLRLVIGGLYFYLGEL